MQGLPPSALSLHPCKKGSHKLGWARFCISRKSDLCQDFAAQMCDWSTDSELSAYDMCVPITLIAPAAICFTHNISHKPHASQDTDPTTLGTFAVYSSWP